MIVSLDIPSVVAFYKTFNIIQFQNLTSIAFNEISNVEDLWLSTSFCLLLVSFLLAGIDFAVSSCN